MLPSPWKMSFCALAAVACLVAGRVSNSWALFAGPDLEQVPVERLQENLAAQVEKSPKDAALRRNLARVHAMAYSSKADEVTLNRGELWFGFTPPYVPFKVAETEDAEKKKQAETHLQAAIEQYEKALELEKDHLATRLGLAWALDQAGKDDRAKELYREVVEQAWKKEGSLQGGRLGGHYLTVEAAGYLIPLLDEEEDAKEIAELKERSQHLKSLPRPITPIAIPLEAGLDAEAIHNREASVRFDADGTGFKHRWTWLRPNAGWLVYDAEGRGQITSATQLFGNASFMLFFEDGYQALTVLDNNGDGQLAGGELDRLAIWRDVNSNGRSEPGEVQQLSAHSIEAINCRHDGRHDGTLTSKAGVTFADGSTRASYDIVLVPQG